MTADVHHFPASIPPLDDAIRQSRLFEWGDSVLQEIGIADQVKRANSAEVLRQIVLNVDTVEIELAIQQALQPTDGPIAAHFIGLTKRPLKNLLKARFNAAKKDRAHEIERGEFYSAGGKRSSAYDWTSDLIYDDKGGVRPLLVNLILFLRYHKLWEGVLAFDEFANRVVIRKPPPWGSDADAPWTDHHESKVRTWFQRHDIPAGQGDCGRAVQAAARDNPFHPVREYFDKLKWDGTSRIDSWPQTYLGVEDSAYVRAIGPRYLISAIARIYEPGAKVDHMFVLEGPQGKLKSEALRTLAIRDAWFTDRLSHVTSKDAAQETAGVMLIEVAEMDALVKATSSSIKAFITRRTDRFRPPYGKHLIDRPRQCVFAGSINPLAGGYLKDPTGARRFWPVACGEIDLKGIERDRDQLWAEAIVRYRADAKWWLETPELEALATAEQAARFVADSWQERIEKWLGDRKDTSVAEVLEGALGMAPQEQTQPAQTRVARILTLKGFTKYRAGSDGARKNRYARP